MLQYFMLKALMSMYSVTTNTLGSTIVICTVGTVMGTCLGVIFTSDLNETSLHIEDKHFQHFMCMRKNVLCLFSLFKVGPPHPT